MRIDYPSPTHIPTLRALWKEAFGDTDVFLDLFWEHAFSTNRCRCVLSDGTPVAALYWFDCSSGEQRLAYLYAVATSSAHRGKGICRMLMEDTHTLLASQGYSGVLLVPGKPSLFDFYEKIGYRIACYVDEFSCVSEESDVELQELTSLEYAALRRTYLPHGGVIQEGENLSFLAKTATLYRGDDFLLAARIENGMLFGIELLGNRLAAPQITHALGTPMGKFRTSGSSRPFAMYLPLTEKTAPMPCYFGLAFD